MAYNWKDVTLKSLIGYGSPQIKPKSWWEHIPVGTPYAYYTSRDTVWPSNQGGITISSMETSHIVNCIKKIEIAKVQGSNFALGFLPALYRELAYRQYQKKTQAG